MKTTLGKKKYQIILGAMIAVIFISIVAISSFSAPKTSALGAGGCDVNGNGRVDANEFCNSWGWGWVNYSVNGSGPNQGFSKSYNPDHYYWGALSDTGQKNVAHLCASYGANSVWMFTVSVKDTSQRRVFGMQATGNAAKDYGTDPNTVYGYFISPQKLYDGNHTWSTLPSGGNSLGWFCYLNASYTLTPTISTNPDKSVAAGSPITATGVVANSGPTQSAAVAWQITQFTVAPGGTVPSGGDSPQTPVAFYKNGATVVSSGSTTFGLSSTPLAPVNATVPNLPLGTKVCFTLSLSPFTQSSSGWRHSKPYCVVISGEPLVQIWGGDLRVGAAFTGNTPPASSAVQTSLIVKTGKSYGSWDEYGIVASGTVTGMASASALAGGLACVGSTCATNNLTFSNESPLGHYVSSNIIPDVASSFTVSASTPQYVSLADAAKQQVETASGTITIGGGTILKGQWLVINAPTATVNITGDINYDSSALSGINDIPQLVIIANQINIAGNVKNVDAWLIASGTAGIINTCSDVDVLAPLTASICNNQLVVNGPVEAKKLYLRRTYNSDIPQPAEPAEVINLRPDAYLWGIYQGSKSGRLETTYERELPPRF